MEKLQNNQIEIYFEDMLKESYTDSLKRCISIEERTSKRVKDIIGGRKQNIFAHMFFKFKYLAVLFFVVIVGGVGLFIYYGNYVETDTLLNSSEAQSTMQTSVESYNYHLQQLSSAESSFQTIQADFSDY